MKRAEELRNSAQQYVNEQIEIMRQHGSEPNLTKKQVNGLVRATEKNLASVAGIRIPTRKRDR